MATELIPGVTVESLLAEAPATDGTRCYERTGWTRVTIRRGDAVYVFDCRDEHSHRLPVVA